MRFSFLLIATALGAALTACSPAKQEAPPAEAPAAEAAAVDSTTRTAVLDALSKAVVAELGQPVDFRIDQLKTDGDWAWVVAMPQALGGGALDFAKTNLASRAENGVLGNDGMTYALLERQDGVWTLCDFVIGPTDVAYLDWPQTYGAPAALMGLEGTETAQ